MIITQGRALSLRAFFIWVLQSVWQAGVIMLAAIYLFEESFLNIVSITFTTLIFTELLNVAFEIHTWHYLMVLSEVVTVIIYILSMVILQSYFGTLFLFSNNNKFNQNEIPFFEFFVLFTTLICVLILCVYQISHSLQHGHSFGKWLSSHFWAVCQSISPSS
jgi:hypothetical protein